MTDRNYTCVADAVQSQKSNPNVKIGDIFTANQGSKAKVIKYINSKNILVEFLDHYKYQGVFALRNLQKGQFKNPYFKNVYGVGCFGVGKYLGVKDGVRSIEYNAWGNMLKRCYNKKEIEKYPTYRDCYVCDEWHNFQNFAEWYTEQKGYDENYELDKDLLISGNKVYSPDTCMLAPSQINSLLLDCGARRGEYPVGVCYDKKLGKFKAQISIDGKPRHIGFFKTVEQASEAYQIAKKANIKRMALEWQDRIDKRLFDALMAKAI